MLETAANPYAAELGARETAASRLNLAQSFNGLGWIVGPLVGGCFLFMGEEGSADISTPYAIIGLVVLTLGLYMVTNLAPAFTLAANDVHKATGDGAVAIPEGFARGGSLDFASSPLAWVIYQAVHNLKWIGSGLLMLATMALMWWNRVLILRSQNNQKTENI